MDKNLLLAVVLSVVVYALWFGFAEKRLAPGDNRTPGTVRHDVNPSRTAPAANPITPQAAAADMAQSAKGADPVLIGDVEALISPRGAAVVSWRDREPLGFVELVSDPHPGFFATWPELSFKRESSAISYSALRPDGLRIMKEFLPGQGTDLPRLRITLSNTGRQSLETGGWFISVGPGLGTIPTEQKENLKLSRALGLLSGEQGLKGKIEKFIPGEHPGNYRWVGIDNRYFLAAMLPPSDFNVSSELPPKTILNAKSLKLAPQETRSWEIPYYWGPKGQSWLSRYGKGLERSIDFGFFAQLGRFIMRILTKLHGWTHNWGWSIILLTVLLQIVVFPLTFKSLKAMTAMKRLQPEITKLQQKYANDQTKMHTELMELYKKNGANPLGGCLPMLLQLPVFYALYNALRNAWELHGAAWVFWIKDLSAKDPFYVLPVIMGGLMFFQNKFNPPSADPSQAQMMTWMPVIFTVMFLNFPSGLVLYWLTNSLISAVQQTALKKYLA